MSRTQTLVQLRTRILRKAGVETSAAGAGSADLTPVVVNEFINDAAARLWDLLKSKRDDRLVTSAVLATAIGVAEVALPSNFLELRKLELVDGSQPSGYRRLRAADLEAQHLYSTLNANKRYRYRLQGENLVLMPTPLAVESLRLYYIPHAPVLVNDSDTLEGFNGYERYVVVYGHRECLDRQDLDTSKLDARLVMMESAILSATDGRDVEPFYLDPRGANDDYYYDDVEIVI